MSAKLQNAIEDLDKSIENLKKIIEMPFLPNDVIMISSIKVFELSFELFWKTLRKKIEAEYKVETFGAKQVLQNAYGLKLIENEKIWLNMLDDRNLGVHIYKQALAHEIFERVKEKYASFLRTEFNKCFK
ncbi:HI0074 family nucleotidyltransferase substrate-binding subunit [Candidatus Babeliales bacterium]|nr:HI0074 family nucleotidyltransferase substrate-binding subunit [Candidatus Babeliales bacterium]